MKVLLTGAGGQLAQDILATWTGHEITPLARAALDITSAAAVDAAVDSIHPDCIVNTAAFSLVDQCEDRYEEAFRANVFAVAHLARAAQRHGAILVQFSTDYVFDGLKRTPYVETDAARPLSAYGASRLSGEWMASHFCQRALVIRTCGLYGIGGQFTRTGNFVESMLRLAAAGKPLRVIGDQIVTPTSTWELAQKCLELVSTYQSDNFVKNGCLKSNCLEVESGFSSKIFHLTNTGECSWFDFARQIFREFGVSADLAPTSAAAYNSPARRPAYSVLDNFRLRQAGIADFRPWQEALARYAHARRKGNATHS